MRLAVTPFRLFLLAVAGQFLFGIVLALPGTLFGLPAWASALGFDVAAQARLLVVFFAGQFAFTAVAGSLVDRVGCQRVLSLGSLLMATAFVLLAGASTAGAATLPSILLAAGGACINAASNTLVSVTYGERRGAMLSLMATFGASGALVAPLVFRGGLCLSRLCAPIVLARTAKLVVVLGASTTAGLSILAMALAPSTAVLAGAVLIAGLAVGPLAPMIVSVAGDRYPRQMGAAIGLLLSIAQIGGMVLPWLTGRATIAYGYRAGLAVPALAAFGVAAGTVLAWQARARRAGVVAEATAK